MAELSPDKVYEQIQNAIRFTDDVSFKLMGFVPLVSGAAIIGLLIKDTKDANPLLFTTLSLFAALIALGIFRWELRNIQACNWLRKRAELIEAEFFRKGEKAVFDDKTLKAPPNGPRFIQKHIGKTEAEKFIYAATIFSWCLLPLITLLEKLPDWLKTLHIILATLIAIATIHSLFAKTRVNLGGDGDEERPE